jgi:hypothetical protein
MYVSSRYFTGVSSRSESNGVRPNRHSWASVKAFLMYAGLLSVKAFLIYAGLLPEKVFMIEIAHGRRRNG